MFDIQWERFLEMCTGLLNFSWFIHSVHEQKCVQFTVLLYHVFFIAKNVPHIWYNIDIIFFKKKTKILVFNDANNKVWNLYSKSCLFFLSVFFENFYFKNQDENFFKIFRKFIFSFFQKHEVIWRLLIINTNFTVTI